MIASSPIYVQRRVGGRGIPTSANLRVWAARARESESGEVTIRIVDLEEGMALNKRYRGKAHATNVLSFSYRSDCPDSAMLGDLVICAPVVVREAIEQGLNLRAHWAHLVIHGVLHLRGYDHERAQDATIMQAREGEIMAALGFRDPYHN